ncbi:MAG: CHAT domain-containing protein [Flavobacteriales bacterium]|nr:CHAT domain-containing protein [Flavobacteriales bacterium]
MSHFEACMLMAECWYQRQSMEQFNAWNDSAAALIVGNDEERWARVEVNRCRYANFFVKPDQAIVWGNSALARYRHAADRTTWKHAYQIYQALGTTHRNIHQGTDVLFALFDTAQTLLAQQPDVIQYWHANLHKAVSNAALDRTMSGLYDPEPYVPLCAREQLVALRILEENYPAQIIDRCTLQDLRALYHMYQSRPDSALWWLGRTEALLAAKGGVGQNDALASTWFACLRYRSFVYDQAPWRDDVATLRAFLAKLTGAQPLFTEYMSRRVTAGGSFFDDTYWTSPFTTIVTTCSRLWELTGDTTYIDQALWASEKIRRDAWNIAQIFRGEQARVLPEPPPDMLRAIQQRLAQDEAVLLCAHSSLAGLKESVFTVAITQHEVSFHSCVLGFNLRNNGTLDPASKAPYRSTYHTLYTLLFKPVEPLLLNAKRLRMFASGDMSFIAFDALLADTAAHDLRACGLLVQRYAFSYPLLLLPPSEVPRPDSGTELYIAPAPGNGQLTDLKRLRAVFRKWAMDARIDSSFTKSDLGNSLRGIDRIYLAGHCAGGFHRDHEPKHFFGTDTTGPSFQPSDLLPLDLRADLVVHLACRSGLFDADRNGSAISFSRAFLLAGARNVVSSQYLADEASTITLVGLFRDELAKGLPKDVAMQHAKLNYLDQCKTPDEMMPIYWAGWQVLGEPEPSEDHDHSLWMLILVAVLIGTMVFFRYLRRG